MEHSKNIYTVKEISVILRISTKTVLRWLAAGELKGVRYGRQWRIWSEDLDEYIKGGGPVDSEWKR